MSRREIRLPEPPVAIVKKPHLRKQGPVPPGTRKGKGFSLSELRAAGLTPEKARKLGIYVDKRRRSVHEWNVKALKDYLEKLRALGVEI